MKPTVAVVIEMRLRRADSQMTSPISAANNTSMGILEPKRLIRRPGLLPIP